MGGRSSDEMSVGGASSKGFHRARKVPHSGSRVRIQRAMAQGTLPQLVLDGYLDIDAVSPFVPCAPNALPC